MSLTVSVRHRLDTFAVEAEFSSLGGITALFGRSGSGKTSLINIVAGLMRPQVGRIVFDGDVLVDTDSRTFLPPHQRGFGYVFQEARLFPHLSVTRNLAYGRWFSKQPNKDASFDRVLDLLGIRPLLDRAPANLSGGEKQRVAIGRALLSNPRLLLMDEPLAALDAERKAEILPYLERLRDETRIPILYVSHSITEVARLADQVVMLEEGKVTAIGDAATVLSLPSSPAGAIGRREAGALIEGTVDQGQAAQGLTLVHAGDLTLRVPHMALAEGRQVRLHIAARDVMLATTRPEGISALNILEGRITGTGAEANGMVDVRVDCHGKTVVSRITALSRDALALETGKTVYAMIKTVALEP